MNVLMAKVPDQKIAATEAMDFSITRSANMGKNIQTTNTVFDGHFPTFDLKHCFYYVYSKPYVNNKGD